MKIKSGFILREVASQTMVVAIGEASKGFDGIIRLNTTGKFLWKMLQKDTTVDELTSAMIAEYDVDKATAETDIKSFIETLKGADLLA
ncbi:MAG: PqqD family protein [Ruminococcus sp.]|nr:PqqD family protein [Ruminococcus sp.]